jgi:hypothetical protein
MPNIKILVSVVGSFDRKIPGPPKPGAVHIFSNDLVLEEYDNKKPGSGLPPTEQDRRAGTHSGYITLLRIAQNDLFFPDGTYLIQYEATYKFNTVPNTPLKKGQITAQGQLALDSKNNFKPLDSPIVFAITGGTNAYVTARGQVTEEDPNTSSRRLDIQL